MAWDDPLDFEKEGIVLDYKTAGVDIDAGNEFVEKLREKAPGIGGFGGMIKIPSGYDEPYMKIVARGNEKVANADESGNRKRNSAIYLLE